MFEPGWAVISGKTGKIFGQFKAKGLQMLVQYGTIQAA